MSPQGLLQGPCGSNDNKHKNRHNGGFYISYFITGRLHKLCSKGFEAFYRMEEGLHLFILVGREIDHCSAVYRLCDGDDAVFTDHYF